MQLVRDGVIRAQSMVPAVLRARKAPVADVEMFPVALVAVGTPPRLVAHARDGGVVRACAVEATQRALITCASSPLSLALAHGVGVLAVVVEHTRPVVATGVSGCALAGALQACAVDHGRYVPGRTAGARSVRVVLVPREAIARVASTFTTGAWDAVAVPRAHGRLPRCG